MPKIRKINTHLRIWVIHYNFFTITQSLNHWCVSSKSVTVCFSKNKENYEVSGSKTQNLTIIQ
jgi:hypothetical protein